MKVAIYARVSTDRGEQDPAVQVEALRRWLEARGDEVTRVFTDAISGAVRERPELDNLLAMAAVGDREYFDAVAIVKLDRLARSTRHLLDLASYFEEHGVDLLVKDQQIDTSTPMGRFMFTILSAVAEFERDLIRERTVAGLEHARHNGKVLGRPQVRSRGMLNAVDAVMCFGHPIGMTARQNNVSATTLRRHVKKARQEA